MRHPHHSSLPPRQPLCTLPRAWARGWTDYAGLSSPGIRCCGSGSGNPPETPSLTATGPTGTTGGRGAGLATAGLGAAGLRATAFRPFATIAVFLVGFFAAFDFPLVPFRPAAFAFRIPSPSSVGWTPRTPYRPRVPVQDLMRWTGGV